MSLYDDAPRIRSMLRQAEMVAESVVLAIENAELVAKLEILNLHDQVSRLEGARRSAIMQQQNFEQLHMEIRELLAAETE